MPAVVSHYLLAESVFDTLSQSCPNLALDRTAFLWGASGPDIFFSHRLFPWQRGKSLRTTGTEMHNTPADKIINYFMSYARNKSDDIAASYTFGFVTHYAFDSTAHPFVLYFANKMSEKQPFKHKSICHNEIESALDTMLLKLEKNERISDFKLQSTSPLDEEVNRVIAELYHSYFLAEKNKNISVETMLEVQQDWNKGLSLRNDSHQINKSAAKAGEKILNLSPMLSPIFRTPHPNLKNDYANVKHTEWIAETNGQPHHENFFELTEQATKLSLQLIAILMSGEKIPRSKCEASFSGH